jgi:hypothetical protein
MGSFTGAVGGPVMRTCCLIGIIAALFSSQLALADSAQTERKMMTLVRVIAADSELEQQNDFKVIVLHAPESAGKAKSLGRLGHVTLGSRALSLQLMEYKSPQAFASAIADSGVHALFIMSGLNAEMREITVAAHAKGIRTLAEEPTYLKSGCLITALARSGRLRIVLNMEAAEELGVRFSPNLLGLLVQYRSRS